MNGARRAKAAVQGAAPAAAGVDECVLVERYMPMVRHIAYALHGMKPPVLNHDDVLQDGMIGLLRAIRSNRMAAEGPQFSAYVSTNIRGAIIDGYRAAGNFSRSEYAKASKVRRAVAAGEEVTAQERAAAERVLAMAWTPAAAVAEEGMAVHDPYPGPEQRAASNQLLRRAVDVLQRKSVRDRTIFIACELEGEAHARVAQRFDVSSGRVSQILKAVRTEILQAIA